MFNVLFTSAGRRVELLRAFRSAYDVLGLQGRIVAIDVDALAPALEVADRRHLVPRTSSADYIAALCDICLGEEVSLVFPLIDPDVSALARHRVEIEKTGARLATVSEDAAGVCADKLSTMEFFRRLGIATPDTWLPGQLHPGKVGFPVFVKPRRGSAAVHAFRAASTEELEFFQKYVPDAIVQEFLTGPEITTDVVVGLDGDVLGVVCRERIEVRAGEVAKGVTVTEPRIVEACVEIAKALSATGPITVQSMMKNGTPHFTEINARFGGGLPLGIAAGADSPKWLLARAAGIPIDVPPLGSYEAGLHMTRFDDSFFVRGEEGASAARGDFRSR